MGTTRLIPMVIRKVRTKEVLGEWKVKVHGRPTQESVEQWRKRFNASLLPGGANAHLGVAAHLLCNLEVYDQRRGGVVCGHVAPMFETV